MLVRACGFVSALSMVLACSAENDDVSSKGSDPSGGPSAAGGDSAGANAASGGHTGAGASSQSGSAGNVASGVGGSAGVIDGHGGASGIGGTGNIGGASGSAGSGGAMDPVGMFDAGIDTQQPGTWVNVTPSGINLGIKAGVNGILYDRFHRGTFYVAASYQGIWKSEDWARTWRKINTTVAMDNAEDSYLGMAADGSYLTSTLLYPTNGATNGCWKSADGGVTWTRYNIDAPNGDVAEIYPHPSDPQWLLATNHSPSADGRHFSESVDGGVTWIDRGPPGPVAGQPKLVWLPPDDVDADTAFVAVYDGGTAPPQRATRNKTSIANGVPQWTWTFTGATSPAVTAIHGGYQPFVDTKNKAGGHNVVYIGDYWNYLGILRSTDNGRSFAALGTPQKNQGVMIATDTMIYASAQGNGTARLQHTKRVPGTPWTSDPDPPGMTDGFTRASSTFMGTHWIVVTVNVNAGIWRYVEP